MTNGLPGSGVWAGAPLPVVALVALQTTTPDSGVGPDELVEYWPGVVRTGWFVAGFLAVVVLSRFLVEPTLRRIVRRRNRNNPTLREAIFRYVHVLVFVVAVFVGAGVAGFGRFLSNSALILSAATLAVGVAGQEVIGSLVSGMALVLDPEFNVGNYIEWEEGEGTVRTITLRVTRVQTPNGELVTIPNTMLTSQSITRPFGRGNYRVVENIGLAYEDDADEAISHLVAVADEFDEILDQPAPNAYVDELGDDAVVVAVHYWIEDPERRDVVRIRSAYARAVKRRFEDVDITISPASQRDLQGRIEVADPA
ncbi:MULTISPECIES: mechanosensitive ion channel family protein [Halorussus]|uniref:mechanosensitive ion channel family protein n=1 Tax=Halorussus TaxID=1070314 RepID=UPI00209DBB02|nr:mechanosensitive ion channel domain-containing protein [Halorussus vallis]USZ76756.1 mechanosensitive ion channel family protein [Halorussus vallis]